LHYLTNRRDSPFWQTFRDRMTIIPSLQQKLELWQEMPLFDHDTVALEMFKAPSWITVGAGVDIFNREAFQRLSTNFSLSSNLNDGYQRLLRKQENVANLCLRHADFIALMKNA
jgi:hypothetical protein